MARGRTAALCALFGLAAGGQAGAAVGWLAGGRVSGAYDDNVNAAPSREEAIGAASWGAGGNLGGWWSIQSTRLQLGVAYEHVGLPGVADLSQDIARASAGVSLPVAWHLRLSAGPFSAARWYGDSERDALDLGGSVRLSWRMLPRLTGAVGGRYTHRNAEVAVYDRSVWGAGIDLELRLARATFPAVAYDVEHGEAVFYGEPLDEAVARGSGSGSSDGSGTGTGKGPDTARKPDDAPSTSTDTFGSTLVAWSEPAWTHVASIGVEQGLGEQFYVDARAGVIWVDASSRTTDRFVSVALGVRLP